MGNATNMSQRSFFDLRYAVPGFTFLLFSVLILSEVFCSLLQRLTCGNTSDVLVGFLLGLLTLLSGVAIGFLVSQIWYILYNYWYKKRRYLKEAFIKLEEFGFNNDKDNLITVIDNTVHTNVNENIKKYIERRYDLFNLLGSTMWAILLVLIFYVLLLISPYLEFDWVDFYFALVATAFLILSWFSFGPIVKENKSMLLWILDENEEDLRVKAKQLRKKMNKAKANR